VLWRRGSRIRRGQLLVVLFEDVEREAVMQLHADGSENCAHRACGAALFADDLADILRRDAQLEDGVFIAVDGLDLNGGWLVHESLGDFPDQVGNGSRCGHIIVGHVLAPDLAHPEIRNLNLRRIVSAHTRFRQQLSAPAKKAGARRRIRLRIRESPDGGDREQNQAAAVATGAGFLVTSFSTIGENWAPTPRQ